MIKNDLFKKYSISSCNIKKKEASNLDISEFRLLVEAKRFDQLQIKTTLNLFLAVRTSGNLPMQSKIIYNSFKIPNNNVFLEKLQEQGMGVE